MRERDVYKAPAFGGGRSGRGSREGVVEELEAVEDLDGAAALDADHAAVDARG